MRLSPPPSALGHTTHATSPSPFSSRTHYTYDQDIEVHADPFICNSSSSGIPPFNSLQLVQRDTLRFLRDVGPSMEEGERKRSKETDARTPGQAYHTQPMAQLIERPYTQQFSNAKEAT